MGFWAFTDAHLGCRLLLGYFFLIVGIAAWFCAVVFVQEVQARRAGSHQGTLIDTATLLAEIGRDDLLSGMRSRAELAQAFSQLHQRPFAPTSAASIRCVTVLSLRLYDRCAGQSGV